MISKAELEALEQALEILSDSTEYRAMCDTVAQVSGSDEACEASGPAYFASSSTTLSACRAAWS